MTTYTTLECPRCKKAGLVPLEHEQDVYECVYCHYRDDLNDPEEKPAGFLFGLAFLLIMTLSYSILVM